MKILVTGNQGFIGMCLTEFLKKEEHIVMGYDLKSGLDTRNLSQLEGVFTKFGPEVVIHLAALTGVRNSYKIPTKYYETNIQGTHNVLEAAKIAGVKKVLVASSSTVYGNQECPLKEEQAPGKAISPYGVSKIATENVCNLFPDLPIIIFRPFTVYGDNGRKNMVVYKIINDGKNNKVFAKYGDGSSKRGYTHVDDLVEGINKLIEYQQKDNLEIFNLGGKEIVILNELIELAKETFPDLEIKEIDKQKGDVDESYANISKAENLVGFSPSRKFKNEFLRLCQQ